MCDVLPDVTVSFIVNVQYDLVGARFRALRLYFKVRSAPLYITGHHAPRRARVYAVFEAARVHLAVSRVW